jgi:hypothetical protein
MNWHYYCFMIVTKFTVNAHENAQGTRAMHLS